ncbi:uncharacterized protein LOC125649702 [Ostrea edulis]|uniref:uncharacterized protein LOC125649702 n=1 Tax=Ostrea edulis TaxID=37623 RepID=UPI0024AEF0E4|nr:uncharacterized protein LOC125649702 [Ostrea edulis]
MDYKMLVNRMQRIVMITCLTVLISCISSTKADRSDISEEIVKSIDGSLKCRNNPALAISVVKDGNVVFSRGFGSRVVGQPLNVSGSTIFGVASLSKAFASTLIVKLLDKNSKYTVDTPLRVVFDDESLFKDEILSRYATIRDLLCHRMGIPGNNAIRLDTNLTRENLVQRMKHLDGTGRFRDSFYYSNLMYGLLTRIAEMLGGKTWEALVKEHIFDPLNMTSSNFATTADPEKVELAKGYIDHYGELKEVPWEFSRRWAELCGSGCVLSTADDMAKWMLFHLSGGKTRNGKRLVSKRALSLTHTPQLRIASSTISKYYTRPLTPVTLSEDSYAMGWKTGYYRGYKILSHTGSTFGYRAKLTLYPSMNLGVFSAMTGDDPSYLYRSNVHNLISDLYLGEEPWLNATIMCSFPEPFRSKSSSSKPQINTNRKPARNVRDYLGLYKNIPYGFATVTKNQTQLTLQFGFGRFELYAKTTKDEFYVQSVGMITGLTNFKSLKFIESSDGTVTAVEISAFESKDPPVFRKVLASSKMSANAVLPTRCNLLQTFLLSVVLSVIFC